MPSTTFTARSRALALAAVSLSAVGAVMGSGLAAPTLAASPAIPVVCAGAQVEAARGVATTFTLSCTDADDQPVDSYVVLSQPTKAAAFSVDSATGAVSYRPVAGATGTDSFTFKGVVDGLGESAVTTATLTLVNQRPVCAAVAPQSVVHDRAASIPLSCTDADGDALTLATGTQGAEHGTVSVVGGTVTYTPAARYVGSDAFTLRAGDGDLLSSEVGVTVAVTNTAPVCEGASLQGVHDRAQVLWTRCSDADGDPLTRSIASAPQHGTVSLSGSKVIYKPARGYVGTDAFRIAATDGLATSPPALVKVKTTNTAPSCRSGRLQATAGRKARVWVSCSDRDGDRLSVVVARRPAHGTLVRSGTRWYYQASSRFAGTDSFELKATDGASSSTAARWSVKVTRARRG